MCAQGNLRRRFGRQSQRFVASITVQRLRTTEDRGHCLERHAHDVRIRLLRRERAPGRLGMKA